MKLFLIFGLLLLPVSLLGQSEIDFLPKSEGLSGSSDKAFSEHQFLPTGIPDALRCQCPRHLAARLGSGSSFGNPSGVLVLDSLPASAETFVTLRVSDIAAIDSTDNNGYKKFYALLQLKAMAKSLGANAVVGLKQIMVKDSLIFTAIAAKVSNP
jgi:hypothetical protein